MDTGIVWLLIIVLTVLIVTLFMVGFEHTRMFKPGQNWHDWTTSLMEGNYQF